MFDYDDEADDGDGDDDEGDYRDESKAEGEQAHRGRFAKVSEQRGRDLEEWARVCC